MSAVTYEITAEVREDLCEKYEQFMIKRHIPDLMATGAFLGASFSRSALGRYRIRYEAHNRESLDNYLASHAPRLRQHMNESFPDGVTINREEWNILATFDSKAKK